MIIHLLAAVSALAAPASPPVVTREVPAFSETTAVQSAEDAADDPAIWRDPRHPSRSLIVATDKKAGLNVYDLSGALKSGLPAGRVNNVDLRSRVNINGAKGVLVAASDRNDKLNGKLALFQLDPTTAKLTGLGTFPAQVTEAYGFCLYQRARDRALFAFIVAKDGKVSQLAIDASGAAPKVSLVRQFALATQSEGCVADDRTGLLYIAEEDVGIWRFSAEPDGGEARTAFAKVDGAHLVADSEGIAIAAEGRRGGYLVGSSQGDSAYAVWRLKDGAYQGRFRITANGAGVDGTSETDGVEISTAGFGPGLKGGLMVAQDGDNAPEAQNFKLVSWKDVKRALKLK